MLQMSEDDAFQSSLYLILLHKFLFQKYSVLIKNWSKSLISRSYVAFYL